MIDKIRVKKGKGEGGREGGNRRCWKERLEIFTHCPTANHRYTAVANTQHMTTATVNLSSVIMKPCIMQSELPAGSREKGGREVEKLFALTLLSFLLLPRSFLSSVDPELTDGREGGGIHEG